MLPGGAGEGGGVKEQGEDIAAMRQRELASRQRLDTSMLPPAAGRILARDL